MPVILRSAGRALAAHWPAMLAWFLAGTVARYLLIQLAGSVGAYSSALGLLLLPLAVLARLVSYVAMFLVMRDALRNLAAIELEGAQRRGTFVEALLASILPFFAVYAAWGMLGDDVALYADRALEVNAGILLMDAVNGVASESRDVATTLTVNPLTVSIIVIAFALRWAWKRWGARLPRGLSFLAVYVEALWVFFFVLLVKDLIAQVTGWIDGRVAVVWLHDLGDWVAQSVAPLAWAWDGLNRLIGEVGGVVLAPLAWLTIAGVVYGQTIAPGRLRLRALEKAKKRLDRVPGAFRRRVDDVIEELVSRFRPIGRAILLMWRAGVVTIAVYVLLFVIVDASGEFLHWGITRLLGPHELFSFWMPVDGVVVLLLPVVVEPIRLALVAGSYDATLRALRAAPSGTPPAPPRKTQEIEG